MSEVKRTFRKSAAKRNYRVTNRGTFRARNMLARYRATPTLSAMSVAGYGLPDRMLVKLRFTDVISFTQTSGTYAEVFYRAIGPYDPRVASGGDYPAYYSQLSALYQYQRVLGSKISVEFMNESSTFGANMAEGVLYPTTTAAGVTALNDAIDKRDSKHCAINWYSAGRWNRLTDKCSPHKRLGIRKATYKSDDAYRSPVGGVPTQILYWAIGTQANDGSTTLAIQARIVINYTIEFMGVVPLDTVDSAND